MALSDVKIRAAKYTGKVGKLADSGGLALRVTASGKYWIFEYDIPGSTALNPDHTKRKTRRTSISFGAYPAVSLAQARQARDEARALLHQGIDPSAARKQAKQTARERAARTFETTAMEWHSQQQGVWTASHAKLVLGILKRYLFPPLGASPLAEITAPEVLRALRPIELRGAIETAHRARTIAGQVFRYGLAAGYCERDPAADLRGALKPLQVKHHPSITQPAKVAELLRAIDSYQGTLPSRCALRLLPLVFTRPGELRAMEWQEIDLEAALWVIPAGKMKMRESHIVPLSRQAIAMLQEMQPYSGGGLYVFPGERSRARPISNNTINAGLRRLGYAKEDMTGHGFRAMARTLLDEQLNYPAHLIEHQLAHTVRDPLGRAYNRTAHIEQRRAMMQAWADYLDSLKAGQAGK